MNYVLKNTKLHRAAGALMDEQPPWDTRGRLGAKSFLIGAQTF